MILLTGVLSWIRGKAALLLGVGLAVLVGLVIIARILAGAREAGVMSEKARTAAEALKRIGRSRKDREYVENRVRRADDAERQRLRDKWTRHSGR